MRRNAMNPAWPRQTKQDNTKFTNPDLMKSCPVAYMYEMYADMLHGEALICRQDKATRGYNGLYIAHMK